LYGPVGSASDPIRRLSGFQADPATGDAPQPGRFEVTDWHRALTANVSVGAEAVLAETVPVRVGAFTNFSAAPSIDGPSDTYGPDAVNAYGATASVGVRADGYDLNLGVAGSLGRGDGYRLNPDPSTG